MLNGLNERRKYQRHSGAICKALVSIDGINWSGVELSDVSAGGLKFVTREKYDINTRLYFNLSVYNMISEFKMKFESIILREEKYRDNFIYAVRFDKADKYHQIQLDEVIKSKASVKDSIKPFTDDEIYTLLLIPRRRSNRISKWR